MPPSSNTDCPRWQRRPAERHREILEAAVLVFGERGFDGATVADVADRAGVSAGTVAHYFGSKGGLFEAVIADRFLEIVAVGEELVATHRGPARELLGELLSRKWHQLMRPGTADLMIFGLAKAQSFPAAAGLMCREIGERWIGLLSTVLSLGIAAGEFRPVTVELHARTIASGLTGLILSAQHFAKFELDPPAPDRLLEEYLQSVVHALAVATSPES